MGIGQSSGNLNLRFLLVRSECHAQCNSLHPFPADDFFDEEWWTRWSCDVGGDIVPSFKERGLRLHGCSEFVRGPSDTVGQLR